MIKHLRVMDSTGDTKVVFDEADAKATAEAKDLFNKLTKDGSAIFAVNRAEGATDKKITQFSELEQDNVVVRPIVGG